MSARLAFNGVRSQFSYTHRAIGAWLVSALVCAACAKSSRHETEGDDSSVRVESDASDEAEPSSEEEDPARVDVEVGDAGRSRADAGLADAEGVDADSPADAASATCVPGESLACFCANGRAGASVCGDNRRFAPCACSAAAGLCSPGARQACACTDGRPGYQRCADDGARFGACACSAGPVAPGDAGQVGSTPDAAADASTATPDAGSPGCPHPEAEWCDGLDNDCNGVADDMEVCEDARVYVSDPFADAVYLLGTTAEGSCGADALQAFWPTQSNDYYAGFDCYADRFTFRMSDSALFYAATFSGIYRDDGAKDTLLATPPCGSSVGTRFGFDGAGHLYYACGTTVRRDNGSYLAEGGALVAVLADGRFIMERASLQATPSGDAGRDYAIFDADGHELSRVSPHAWFSGALTVYPDGASVSGNRAYVLFRRTYGQNGRELVVFRVDEQNRWQLARRVAVDSFGVWTFVISDGTVFVRESDPATTFDQRIRAFLPDGSVRVVWREADRSVVRAHIGDQLLVGPLVASGPSVKH